MNVKSAVVTAFSLVMLMLLTACGGDSGGGGGGGGSTPPPEEPTELSITSTTPADGATGIATDANITITFSKDLDSSTITTDNFVLQDSHDANVVVSLTLSGRTVTVDPQTNLTNSDTYSLSVLSGLKDSEGNAFQDQAIGFTIEAQTFAASATPGIVIAEIGSDSYGRSVAIDGDGKIVVAGSATDNSGDHFAVARFDTDGSLDATFDTDGTVMTTIAYLNEQGRSVAIDGDGKTVVVGSTYLNTAAYAFALARYNTDGSLDTTFDTDGKVTTILGSSGNSSHAYDVAVQTDGKIVVVGDATNTGNNVDFAVARYNTDGSLDTTFDTDGMVTTAIGSGHDIGYGAAIDGNGKIVVVGYSSNGTDNDVAVVRYNTNGSLDTTFGTGGKVTTDFGSGNDIGYGVAIDSNGKIVVVGSANNGTNDDFAVIRYNVDGTLDTAFDTDGKLTTAFGSGNDNARSVAIDSNFKIVVAGSTANSEGFTDAVVARYTVNGVLDTGFDTDGKVITDAGTGSASDSISGIDVVIQGDGKILVAGTKTLYNTEYDRPERGYFSVIRYNTDGSLDE